MRTTVLDIANERLRDIRRDDSGAALVITLGVFMFLVMVTGGVYAIGENVRQKIELQNAVDAAAYSASNVQADILSRMATVNRAMSWTYVQMCNRQMDYIVAKCSVAGLDHHGVLAKAAIDETKRGVFEDKATKNIFA